MNEKDPALKIINEVFFRRTTYTVGKKVKVIEPMDEYWRECTALLILAVVHYLKEHRSKDEHCYFAVLDFINKARHMSVDELTALFGDGIICGTSEAFKVYSDFLDKAGKTVTSVMIAAITELKGIYFDKQGIAEFERVFEL